MKIDVLILDVEILYFHYSQALNQNKKEDQFRGHYFKIFLK